MVKSYYFHIIMNILNKCILYSLLPCVPGKLKRAIINRYGPVIKEDDFRRAFVTMVYYSLFKYNFHLNTMIIIMCLKLMESIF